MSNKAEFISIQSSIIGGSMQKWNWRWQFDPLSEMCYHHNLSKIGLRTGIDPILSEWIFKLRVVLLSATTRSRDWSRDTTHHIYFRSHRLSLGLTQTCYCGPLGRMLDLIDGEYWIGLKLFQHIDHYRDNTYHESPTICHRRPFKTRHECSCIRQ